jgi:DNA uptake protein ComE-like DNA-binding protein
VDELTEVKGIGPANLEKLRPYLRAGAAPTP